jgi:tetratricopeptide (TPR) repeat protein
MIMRQFLRSLGFSINEDLLSLLMGQMKAAQQYRKRNNKTVTDQVTRSTALAVIIYRSSQVRQSLASLGLRYHEYLDSIGLKMPIDFRPEKEITIHDSFKEAIVRYVKSADAVLETSNEVFAIAILEDAVSNLHDRSNKYELEGRLRHFGVDIDQLAEALQSRSLPFDMRRVLGSGDSQQRTANALRQAGRLQEALGIYQQMKDRFPANPAALAGMAETLRELGEHRRALEIYEQMRERFPDDPVALAGVAETLRGLGHYDRALETYERMSKQFPANPMALAGMAETLRGLGQHDRALEIYQRMSEHFPTDPTALAGMAETLRGLGQHDRALEIYQRMSEQFPTDPTALAGMAETLRELGQYDRALEIYQRMSEQFPTDPMALAGMAETLRGLGRIDQATAIENEAKNKRSAPEKTKADSAAVEIPSTAPFYSDHPAELDLLNRKAVAETIATMIENVWKDDKKEKTIDRTFMVHLHGRWGSGKTSILNFLMEALLSQNPAKSGNDRRPSAPSWVIVDFNAWRIKIWVPPGGLLWKPFIARPANSWEAGGSGAVFA